MASGGAGLAVGVACCALTLAALPVFMVGGLAVQIRAELGITEVGLGAAVSVALLSAAVTAPLGGRVADHFGARRGLLIGSALTALSLVGVFTVARSWGQLVILLAVSGVGLALTDPGLAALIADAVPRARQGVSLGIKEAAIPAASLAAGLAVPGIALTLGWRWAGVVALLPLVGLGVLLPRVHVGARRATSRLPTAESAGSAADDVRTSGLLLVAVATALGATAASGIGVFLTESAVAMGLSPSNAGLLLAVGGVAGILARIAAGLLADRRGGPQLRLVSRMLAVGAAAMLLGATGRTPLIVIGTVGVFAAGWGWTGLLFLSLIRARPSAPGAAAGVGVLGLTTGNALGPLLFGAAAQTLSFGAAWSLAAGLAALAAALMRLAHSGEPGSPNVRTAAAGAAGVD